MSDSYKLFKTSLEKVREKLSRKDRITRSWASIKTYKVIQVRESVVKLQVTAKTIKLRERCYSTMWHKHLRQNLDGKGYLVLKAKVERFRYGGIASGYIGGFYRSLCSHIFCCWCLPTDITTCPSLHSTNRHQYIRPPSVYILYPLSPLSFSFVVFLIFLCFSFLVFLISCLSHFFFSFLVFLIFVFLIFCLSHFLSFSFLVFLISCVSHSLSFPFLVFLISSRSALLSFIFVSPSLINFRLYNLLPSPLSCFLII